MLIGVIVAIVIGGFFFYASYSINSGIYLKSLCRNKEKKKYIALTFDDGIDPVITPKVLDVLRRYNAKATFFIIGEKVGSHSDIIRRILLEGHAIGNHSYTHRWNFPMKRTQAMCDEIRQCNNALHAVTGQTTTLFRPPFGVTNPMVGRAVLQSGMCSVGWSIRSLDTIGQETEKVARRVCRRLQGGEVVLLHDNRENADVLLEMILEDIQKKGLEPVTIYTLFDINRIE